MFRLNNRKMDAVRIYLLLSGAQALFFALVFTVNMVYQVQTVGLSPLQLVLVGTTLELSVFIFEIPTGIVADLYSRRLSIIIGVALIGLGFMFEGAFAAFWAVLLSQFLWGLGHTFTSGATSAWLVDEVGELNAGAIFLQAAQTGRIGGLLGIVLSVVLGSITLALPIVVGGVLFVGLSLFLVLFMPETGFQPAPPEERRTWRSMARTLRDGTRQVRGRPILMLMVGIGLFYGLYSEGFDRLWTPHILDNLGLPVIGTVNPIVWFGVLSIVTTVIGYGMTTIVMRRVDTRHYARLVRALLMITGLMMVCMAGFALAGGFTVGIVMYVLYSALRGQIGPLFDTWANQHIESNVRATVLSMFGQVDAIGQIGGGPVVGVIGERFGIRAALMTSTAILSPVLLLYAWALRRKQPDQPETIVPEQA